MTPLRLLAAAVFATAMGATVAQPAPDAAPYGRSQAIRGQWIVLFHDRVANPHAQANGLVAQHGGRLLHSYGNAVKGFAAQLPDAAVQALRNNPNVASIEQDATVSLSGTQSPVTWGLDRIDQRNLPLGNSYTYGNDGTGVTAFIIDTGIRPDHVDFGGRVDLTRAIDTVGDGRGPGDCNGHGTHVAGTVGGATWGVAKNVTLVPVRVLNCRGSGSWSGVIAGVDHVASYGSAKPVANMSLGGGFSASVNAAVAGAVSQGVTMVVSAGNDGANACNNSPASEPSAITVGSTTASDARSSFSNYGTCVDVFAPGSGITSAWYTSTTATNTISGTSMASPHVTGVAALARQADPDATPAGIASVITSSASMNKVTNAGSGSPNRLLYSQLGAPVATTSIAVASLSGTASGTKKGWRAQVTVGIGTLPGFAPLANVTVTGSFAPGGSASCVTGSTGTCSMQTGQFSNGVAATVFTVTGASATNVTYDSSQNAASSVTISKP